MAAASTIGQGTVVRGNVRGEGSLVIDGRVEGDVNVDGDVTLGEHGAVKGNVSGARISVAGAVAGNLHGTDAVLLESSARVVGDLGGRGCARAGEDHQVEFRIRPALDHGYRSPLGLRSRSP